MPTHAGATAGLAAARSATARGVLHRRVLSPCAPRRLRPLGRRPEHHREPPLPRPLRRPPPLDVHDAARRPLSTTLLGDAGGGPRALGHEPGRLPSDAPPLPHAHGRRRIRRPARPALTRPDHAYAPRGRARRPLLRAPSLARRIRCLDHGAARRGLWLVLRPDAARLP